MDFYSLRPTPLYEMGIIFVLSIALPIIIGVMAVEFVQSRKRNR